MFGKRPGVPTVRSQKSDDVDKCAICYNLAVILLFDQFNMDIRSPHSGGPDRGPNRVLSVDVRRRGDAASSTWHALGDHNISFDNWRFHTNDNWQFCFLADRLSCQLDLSRH